MAALCIDRLEEYENVCCSCGCPLKLEDIAARFIGEVQNFRTKVPPQSAALVFCDPCLEKCEKYANDSVRAAWFRAQQLEER